MNPHLTVGIALAVIYVAVIALILSVARKSRNGTLRRNPLLGARTRQTQSSDAAWRAGQRESQQRYARLAPVLGIAAVVSLVNGIVGGPFWVYVVIVVVSGTADVAIAVSSATAANVAARRERQRPV